MDPLNLKEQGSGWDLSIHDESHSDNEGFISVTLSGEDFDVGVFLDREQAFAMWAWLYGILYGEPKWNDDDFGKRIRERVSRGEAT